MKSERVVLRIPALVLVLLIGGVAIAAGLSIDDLTALKKAGFSDDEIQKEIDRTETRLVPTERDVRKLRAVGFSQAFIDRLRAEGSPELTLDTVRRMTARGVKPEEIISLIAASGKTFRLTAREAIELSRARVDSAVVRTLRGGALKQQELLRLARDGAREATQLALIDALGADFTPSAAETVKLMQKGVPVSVIQKLRETAPAPEAEPAADWHYEHPLGRFGLEVPAGWRHLTELNLEDFVVRDIFTPERDTSDPAKVRSAFTITTIPVSPESKLAGLTLADTARTVLVQRLAEEPDLAPLLARPLEKGTLGGVAALFSPRRGAQRGREDGSSRSRFGIARKDGFVVLVRIFAERSAAHRMKGAFQTCIAKLRLGPATPVSPGPIVNRQTVTDRSRPSVVMVVGTTGGRQSAGNGFIIREDGIVLTSHAAIWDMDTKRPHRNIQLHFDASLNRPPVRAALVAEHRPELNGAGSALLRITEPGRVPALALGRSIPVRATTPVLTLGFPRGGALELEALTVIATPSTVRKVMPNPDYHGGPVIDARTGEVIGVCSSMWRLDPQAMIPIQAFRTAYADVLDLAAGADRLWGPTEHFAHALDLYGRGAYAAAERRLARTLALAPKNTDAMFLNAACALGREDSSAFAQWINRVLKIDPDNGLALLMAAGHSLAAEDYAPAMRFANRAIQVSPADARPYLLRAEINLGLRRYQDALRDADLVARKTRGRSTDAEILAGRALFELQRLDEGLARFNRVLKLNPADLTAQLAKGLYYEEKRLYSEAAREYEGIARRHPKAPEPEESLGRCLVLDGKKRPALAACDRALAKIRNLGRTPPESLFRTMTGIRGISDDSTPLFIDYVNACPGSANAHVQAAMLHGTLGERPGLAYAHALIAQQLTWGDATVRKQVRDIPPASLSISTVAELSKLGYGPVAMTIVELAPIGFEVSKDSRAGRPGDSSPMTTALLSRILSRQEAGRLGPMGEPGGHGLDRKENPPSPMVTAVKPDAPHRPELEVTEWNAPDGKLMVPVPKGFTVDDRQVRKARQNGFGFIRFYAVNRKRMAEVCGCVFDASIRTFPDAFEKLQAFRASEESRMKVEEQQEITIDGVKGRYARGIIQFRNRNAAPFELVLIPAPGGIRAMFFASVPDSVKPLEKERQALLTGFRPARPAPPEPTMELMTFRDPSGLFTVDFPKTFAPANKVMATHRRQGIGFIRFVAAKRDDRARISVIAFGVPTRTAEQALSALQLFEPSRGQSMLKAKQEPRKIGELSGTAFAGTIRKADGSEAQWEAVFVPSTAGVMGIIFTAPTDQWESLTKEREALLSGLRVTK